MPHSVYFLYCLACLPRKQRVAYLTKSFIPLFLHFIKKSHFFYCLLCAVCLHTKQKVSHTESSHQRCSVKKVFLQISQISQENTCVGVSKKETLTWVFSCQIFEIFRNTYFEECLQTTASGHTFLCSTILIRKMETNPKKYFFFFLMCRCTKNVIGCINDTFWRTTTLFSMFFSRHFPSFWVYMCCQRIPCLPKILDSWKRAITEMFPQKQQCIQSFPIEVCEDSSEKLVGQFPWY